MWIPKVVLGQLHEASEQLKRESWHQKGRADRLQTENERMRADLDWFKLRLNQVERERGQLIQAAIGVKIAVPEFVPTFEDPGKALNEMPDLSTVGHDAAPDPTMQADPGEGVDYSQMPGYGKR